MLLRFHISQAKAILLKTLGDTYLATFNNVGKKPASFSDAIAVAEEVLSHEADTVQIVYNNFVNVVTYKALVSAIGNCELDLEDSV